MAVSNQGDPSPAIVVRDMYLADLDDVLVIERSSFPTPWSRQSFLSELVDNTFAVYLVLEFCGRVAAYGGMWLILDEAHVTNVAVLPEFRGHGFGEAMMEGLITRAVERRAQRMTLEVARSNAVAQKLYAKLGFVQLGIRRGYYSNPVEDALIMWRDPLLGAGGHDPPAASPSE